MKKVTELVAELAAPAVAEQGCTLWDVEYVREAGQWYLRLYLDKDGSGHVVSPDLHRQGDRCVHRRLRGGLPPPVRRTG